MARTIAELVAAAANLPPCVAIGPDETLEPPAASITMKKNHL
jgi:hypothetical protein